MTRGNKNCRKPNASVKFTTLPKRERSTTEWKQRPYLSKLWCPNKNIPQRHNQLLFGDAVGVVRRLAEVMGKQELIRSRGSVSAQILQIVHTDWNSIKN